ncbi:MAG: phenylalanine--tRNA ligase subunit beta [SAR202 cluster bacterium]|nr:phenylalanine--tRNA ligase subunit beta [SAR202 cluster bacterium]
MQVPLSWLKKYVPITLPPRELAHRLTMAGVEVTAVHEQGTQWERDKVLVGHVLKVEPHPNADRLRLPTVDLGKGEQVTVVCGAPNVAAGQKIIFAKEGARLFNTHSSRVEPLRPANIRGVRSVGMVCSALELDLGQDQEGIVVLPDDAPIGAPAADYLGDIIFEIETTPNRPDCLCVLGIAHEVAALTGQKVTEPDLSYPEDGDPIVKHVAIEIADPDLCHRYTASLITGVKVGPSPKWLQDALAKSGQRPINNVVDVTNYVMLEYNQPLHAFDFDKVKERHIIVRQARPGEELVTLDGATRKLSPPMLVIADAHDAVGLAGVMGGANTEVSGYTTAILLESANFEPINTRRTSAALKLSTGAAYRFERAIRAELAPLALRRATQLILQVAGGKAAKGIVDLQPRRNPPPVVRLTRCRVKQVLGADLSMSKVQSVLVSLGFTPTKAEGHGDDLVLEAPFWRSDIAIEDDLVEEIARIIGYDEMPTTSLSGHIPHHVPQPMWDLKQKARDLLAAAGMHEAISYSLTSHETLERAEVFGNDIQPLAIANPMSAQFQYLRPNLRGSMFETLAANWRTSPRDGLRLFEIGRAYLPRQAGHKATLPDERETLIAAFAGRRFPLSWLAKEQAGQDMSFFDAKGVLESLLSGLGVETRYEPAEDSALLTGRAARILCGDQAVGAVGEVHPRILERFDLTGAPVAIFEIDLAKLLEAAARTEKRYSTAGRFPESARDIALVVSADVSSESIEAVIKRHKMVRRITPFDVFVGSSVAAGKRSIAYQIVFQSPKDTLTAEQVSRALEDILRQLQRELGAEMRV